MTSFMGPMAPPPPAQPQPQALDIRTDPNQRQQFKQFMRQRMMPMTSAPIAQPPMMPMMQSPAMFNMGGGVDIFDPMYSAPMMAPPAPMGFNKGGSTEPIEERFMESHGRMGLFRGNTFLGFKQEPEKKKADPLLSFANIKRFLGFDDGGAVPPRRADIQGQDHMLSYITPDEADILMALGGSGEAGPMGIPAFPEPGMGGDQDDRAGSGNEGSDPASDPGGIGGTDPAGDTSGGGSSGDSGAGESGDTFSDMGMSPSRSQAQFGTTEFAGKSVQEAQNILAAGGGSDEAQAVQQSIAAQQRADAQRAAAAEAARQTQIRNQQIAQDNINRTRDRVQAGLAQRNVGVGKTPEVNLSVTRNPTPTTFNVADTLGTGIASTINTGPRDTRGPDAGRTDLLGIDDLLAIDDIASRPPGEMFDPNQTQFAERGLVTDMAVPNLPDQFTTPAMSNVVGLPDELSTPAMSSVAPSVSTTAPVADPNAPGQLTAEDLANLDALAKTGFEDETAAIGMRGPGSGYTEAGLPTGLDFVDTPQGRMTTNLAGTTAAQRAAMPGYMNTRNEDGSLRGGIAGLVDPILGNPVSSVYGYEIPNLATGQITGFTGPSNLPGLLGQGVSGLQDFIMGPPKTTEDLLQRGVYTGFGPGSQIGMEEGGEDQPVKAPTDPCPDGFVMKNGACTPIDSGAGDGNPPGIGGIGTGQPPPPPAPVIVPSPRQPVQTNLQGPVGYGMPTAGQINPFAVSSAGLYQQMLNQQAANPPQFMPIRLQQGGPVSSNLDRAADNFLKALMPAA